MKKSLLALAALMLLAASFKASADAPDLKFVGAKVGLLPSTGEGLPLGANFEMPMKNANPNLSVGAQFMYQSYSEEYSWFTGTKYSWNYTYLIVTGFGAYYYDLLKNEKIKTYGKLHLGYNIASVSFESSDKTLESLIGKVSAGGFVYGFNVGAKYMLTSNLAATLELGYGLSLLQLGVDYGF